MIGRRAVVVVVSDDEEALSKLLNIQSFGAINVRDSRILNDAGRGLSHHTLWRKSTGTISILVTYCIGLHYFQLLVFDHRTTSHQLSRPDLDLGSWAAFNR